MKKNIKINFLKKKYLKYNYFILNNYSFISLVWMLLKKKPNTNINFYYDHKIILNTTIEDLDFVIKKDLDYLSTKKSLLDSFFSSIIFFCFLLFLLYLSKNSYLDQERLQYFKDNEVYFEIQKFFKKFIFSVPESKLLEIAELEMHTQHFSNFGVATSALILGWRGITHPHYDSTYFLFVFGVLFCIGVMHIVPRLDDWENRRNVLDKLQQIKININDSLAHSEYLIANNLTSNTNLGNEKWAIALLENKELIEYFIISVYGQNSSRILEILEKIYEQI